MNFSIGFTMLQGLIVGVTLMVPGMSGGTMAMVLGAYDRLIQSISSFRRHKKRSILFLLAFSVPAIVGMVLLAKPLLHLIESYEKPMMYFFMGAVAGSIPMIYRKVQVKRINGKFFGYLAIGIVAVLLIARIPEGMFGGAYFHGLMQYLIQILGGIIVAVALVLPGISVSYMLVLMGIYEPTMEAISAMNIPALLPLVIGCLLGILLTTKLLDWWMRKFPFAAYLVILGFVLGSAVSVFPGLPFGGGWVICLFTFLAGFFIIYILSKKEEALEGAEH